MPTGAGAIIVRFTRLALALAGGAIVTGAVLEGAARLAAPEQQRDTCAIAGSGGRFRANCTSAPMKLAEGPWLTNTTNDCGLRTAEPCRVRAPGQLRVAVVGTSISRGHFVPYPDTWAARATMALARRCRRPVDFQNLSIPRTMENGRPVWRTMTDRLGEAVALRPDAIVTVMTAVDLSMYPPGSSGAAAASAPAPAATPAPAPHPSLKARLVGLRQAVLTGSRAILLMRVWLNRDAPHFADLYLQHGDDADFLRAPLTPAWNDRLDLASGVFARVGATAKAAHVPWFVLLMPIYGQAALAAEPHHDGDPYLLGRSLGQRVEAAGGTFFDLTGDMARLHDLDRRYYLGDGHPNAAGSAVIAARVEDLIRTGAPAFAGCGTTS
ncbi:MAG: hypothetical protein ACRYG4_11250 [Janthinobacterium lividum]